MSQKSLIMDKEIINRIKIPAILMVTTLIIVILDILAIWYGLLTFGQMVNKFHPCTSSDFPAAPPYCSIGYDFSLIYILAVIFILSLLTMLVKIVLFLRNNKKL
jgi:hypothetical protein